MKNALTNLLKNNTFYYLFLIIICVWHLWSLIYSPLPWFDETFFVSITKALLNGHGFMLEVCPIQTEGKEVLTYGPVYFSFTGLSFLIFGTGIFQFRIVALFFAALSIAVFSRMASRLKMGIVVTRILSLLLIFDVITVQSSHSGRMDMVALFFGLVAWWAYLHVGKNIKYTIVMAIAGVTAVLTTPRVAIVVFPLFTYALVQLLKSNSWLRAGLITLLPAFVYYVWIVFAFGSINGLIEHFAGAEMQNTDSANNIFNYLGGNLYVPFHQWPLIIIGVLTAAWLIVKRMNLPTLFLITLPIITFYIVVADTGAYSALIMPFGICSLDWGFGWHWMLKCQKLQKEVSIVP